MAANHHATLVVLRDRGVLIRGQAGTGKTSFALALVDAGRRRGWFASLVADDQVLLHRSGARLRGSVPPPLAGLAEIRPLGPRPAVHEPAAMVDLVVDLRPATLVPRMREDDVATLDGTSLPCLVLPQRDYQAGIPAVVNFLFDGAPA